MTAEEINLRRFCILGKMRKYVEHYKGQSVTLSRSYSGGKNEFAVVVGADVVDYVIMSVDMDMAVLKNGVLTVKKGRFIEDSFEVNGWNRKDDEDCAGD